MKKYFSLLFLTSLGAVAPESPQACQETGPQPCYLTARYTSPKGIGYNSGYTTLSGFFSWLPKDEWVPFLDLRAHVFDDGKFASNAGFGFRFLSTSRVWGANAYYDYRKTYRRDYNQAALGLETLGKIWDFRVNAFIPVGTTRTRLKHTRFDGFRGHHMRLRSTREYSFQEYNGEIGAHVDSFKSVPLYFAAGPYYLHGKGASVWGGEARLTIDLFSRYIRLEGNTSYDRHFKWIGQGQISLNIPFGPKKKIKNENRSCHLDSVLYRRAVQRVDRQEIIPISHERVHTTAINPATQEPYYFVFVNNLSHSLGTFESPYSSLLDAQNNSGPSQIIYVYPGDGTTFNMDQGIVLQDSQQLLGASLNYTFPTTLGMIHVPAMASIMPRITNSTGSPVIELANSNTISAFTIENTLGNGIVGNGFTSLTVNNNTLVGGNIAEAVFLTNPSGQLTFQENSYYQNTGATPENTVHIEAITSNFSGTFTNETYYAGRSGGLNIGGIFANLSNTSSIGSLTVSGSHFVNSGGSHNNGNAIAVTLNDASSMDTFSVMNSTFDNWFTNVNTNLQGSGSVNNLNITGCKCDSNNNGNSTVGIYTLLSGTGSINNFVLDNCTLNGYRSYGVLTSLISSGGINTYTVQNSHISNTQSALYTPLLGSGSIQQMNVTKSTFSNNQFGIFPDIESTGSIENFVVSGCTITGGNGGFGVLNYLNGAGNMTNFTIQDTTINNNTSSYSIIATLTNTGSITNYVVKNCAFNGNSNGGGLQVDLSSAGSIENLSISNTSISSTQNALYVNLTSTGSINNFSVDGSTFNNNGGFGINVNLFSTGLINNFSIANSSIQNNLYGIDMVGPGAVNNLSISQNDIAANVNYGIFLNQLTVDALNVDSNTFTANNTAFSLVPVSSQLSANIANNNFNDNINRGFITSITTGTNTLSITGNNSTITTIANTGYALSVNNNGGSICMDFTHNSAQLPTLPLPVQPFVWNNTAGTFNVTSDSTQANNVGTISTTGVIGSCTQ